MSVQKHKNQPGFGISRLSNSPVNQGILESQLITGKKVDNIPHSSYYLFDDDYDFAIPRRNISGYKKSDENELTTKGNTGNKRY